MSGIQNYQKMFRERRVRPPKKKIKPAGVIARNSPSSIHVLPNDATLNSAVWGEAVL